ncbi:DHA2 family efflux MFS transporter permease subunit [Megalodesulfovibrio paquesii]
MSAAPAPAQGSGAQPWQPSVNLWLIAASVMLPTIMEVLDTTMANVALPHIAGNLSATQDEATWVLTSYLVSNAIVLPMTGWLSIHMGRKRFQLLCVVGFTLASCLCALSTTLPMLIVARILQGAAGGALQPLSQAILLESAPPGKRGVTMAIYGLGVVVAPIIGPTLGGWLTDNYSWRWMFFINLPIGILAFFMCQAFVEDPPYLAEAKKRGGGVDYIGFGFLALWLSTLQVVLDKGQQEDWFATPWIVWFSGISVLAFLAFVAWEFRVKSPLVNLRVLAHRNFAIGTALMTCMGVILYATVTLQPLFLQSLMNYSALESGLTLSPRGLGAITAMVLVSRLISRIDPRKLIIFGFAILMLTAYEFSGITLQINQGFIAWPNVIMGLGMGFVFVPLSTVSMGGLPVEQMGHASGIYNLMRNLGGSVGISVVTTMLSRGAQRHQALLSHNYSATDSQFQEFFTHLVQYFSQHTHLVQAKLQAMAVLQSLLVQQATLLAYIECFQFLALTSAICVPGALLLRRARRGAAPVAAH